MKSQIMTLGLRFALAAGTVPWIAQGAIFQNLGDVKGKLCEVLNWVYTFALIVGVMFILFAAFQYITANGSAEKVTSANKALLYAAAGIAIAIIAGSVPALIGSFLGASGKVEGCS